MADWRCLTAAEQSMVRELGHDPEPMIVNRTGDGQWLLLDMKTRMELIVSLDGRGRPKGTAWMPEITPPVRSEADGWAGSGRGGTSIMDSSCI